MSFKSYFFFILLCTIVFFITHEVTHAVIFEYYGCENIKYGASLTTFFVTADCYHLQFTNDIMMLAHSINDIIGYVLMPFIIVLVAKK